MGKTFSLPEIDVILVLNDVWEKYHGRLKQHDVRIGIVMAYAPVDKNGERIGTALKGYAGFAAGAQVSIVSLKDRLTKKYDVEILIDADFWPELTSAEKRALLDHELTHVVPTGEKDALDRPMIKMRKEDFAVWGFHEVIARHGKSASEAQHVEQLIETYRKLAPAAL